MFDFAVYGRGAMTLEALREEIGDRDFFRLLKAWARRQAGSTVTTAEFIRLAERVSGEDLDALFEEWLSAGKPDIDGDAAAQRSGPATRSTEELPAAIRSLVARHAHSTSQPFKGAPRTSP